MGEVKDWQRCKITVTPISGGAFVGKLWDWENQSVFTVNASEEDDVKAVMRANLSKVGFPKDKVLDLTSDGVKALCGEVTTMATAKKICAALEISIRKTGFGDEVRVAYPGINQEESAAYCSSSPGLEADTYKDVVATAIYMWKFKHGVSFG